MSQPAHRVHYTFAEYIALEQASNVKHEYLKGQIYAMAGGTPEHAALAAAVSGLMFAQIQKGRCRVYSSDLRVRVLATGLATYPDVTVMCGPVERDPDDKNTAVNPTVIVEVTSTGTEEYDRGEKLEGYQKIPSVRDIVLVSHREHKIETWQRRGDEWTRVAAGRGERVRLDSIGCTLDVDAVYQAAAGS